MNLNFLLDQNLFWIPFVVFGVLILIGTIIGWKQGIIKASIFLGLNVIFAIIIVLLFTFVFNKTLINKILIATKIKIPTENFDAVGFLFNIKYVIGVPLFAVTLILMNITLIPLIYFVIYLIALKVDKANKVKKNIWSKVSGGSLGLLTSSFIAIPTTLTAFSFTINSEKLLNGKYKNVYSILNTILKTASFKKLYNEHEIQSMQKAITLLNDENSSFNVIRSLFDGGKIDEQSLEAFKSNKASREKLTSLLNDGNLLGKVLKSLKIKKTFKIDGKDKVEELLKNIKPKIGNKDKLKINPKSIKIIKDYLIKSKAIDFQGVTKKEEAGYLNDIVKSVIN